MVAWATHTRAEADAGVAFDPVATLREQRQELEVRAAPLREERPLGSSGQPAWTGRHRFSEVEIYVLPAWELSTEAGWDVESGPDRRPTHAARQELEIGLPGRLQLDYVLREEARDGGDVRVVGHSLEASYALADWDEIPLNPTPLVEWTFGVGRADEIELKLLIGDELAPRWHWGANAIFEAETGGEREREIGVSAAAGYTVLDERLGVGAEVKLVFEREREVLAPRSNGTTGIETEWEASVLLGPSVQWRPTERLHADLAILAGTTEGDLAVESFFSIAYAWGPGAVAEEVERVEPASTIHR